MPVEPQTVTLGILADTHIPDRASEIPSGILNKFRQAGVSQILHAGDVSSWKVIHALEAIAPVAVVQGNRDWFRGIKAPREITQTIHGIRITLTHGHRSMPHYVKEKWIYLTRGYPFKRYYQTLTEDFPNSDVIIFGHTHYQAVKWIDDQLFFNPGAAYAHNLNQYCAEFGILSITPQGVIRTECYHLLPDYRSVSRASREIAKITTPLIS